MPYMQNLSSICQLGDELWTDSHTKVSFAVPLLIFKVPALMKAISFCIWQSVAPLVVTFYSTSFYKFSQNKMKMYFEEILLSLRFKIFKMNTSPKQGAISQSQHETFDTRNQSSIEAQQSDNTNFFSNDNSNPVVRTRLHEEPTALEMIEELQSSGRNDRFFGERLGRRR